MTYRSAVLMRAGLFGASLAGCLTTPPLKAQALKAQALGTSRADAPNAMQLSGWLESEIRIFPQPGLYTAQR